MPGASSTSASKAAAPSSTGSAIRAEQLARARSRRQRSSGPTAMIATSISAIGPAALLK